MGGDIIKHLLVADLRCISAHLWPGISLNYGLDGCTVRTVLYPKRNPEAAGNTELLPDRERVLCYHSFESYSPSSLKEVLDSEPQGSL